MLCMHITLRVYTYSTFIENYSPNGIVAVSYAALEFTGINNFSSNTAGPAVRVRALVIYLYVYSYLL